MRFNISAVGATLGLLATSALAANPNNCNTESKARDGADFVLHDQGANSHLAKLSAVFSKAGKNVSVAHVFDDGNHKTTKDKSGRLLWESTADYDDFNTNKWVPQGISSTIDAVAEGTYEGKDGWVVTWHRDDDKSVRVAFVDRKTGKYRHALLVYPEADDDFREVPVHAGGVVWYGGYLWVVDTNNGIRLFDLNNIWQVESGDGVGKKSGGGYSAAGYKYVIPQASWYKWTPDFPLHFSFISLDRTSSPESLTIGEWVPKSKNDPIRLVKWDLDPSAHKLKTDKSGNAKASWAYCVGIHNLQGALQVQKNIYLTTTSGDVYSWTPGNAAVKNSGFYPHGPEDLSYDKRGDKVYTVTESAGSRYIIEKNRKDIKV